ncbi:MAG: superinfection immunity protein [Proteobacteria bacterium]|nr:superinfection immunity protein [Pseudomonadota bacterium]
MFAVIVAAILIYFLPSMLCIYRRHLNATAIFLTNLLLGWTIIGWIVALIWAFTNSPATVAATGNVPVPRPMAALKVLLSLIITLCLLVGWVKTHSHLRQSSVVSTPTATRTIKAGVPVPADELLGK